MPIISVGQITIVDVNDGVDGLDGPALQIISSAAGFTYEDGVASPADQTIAFTLLRQGLDNTEANWAASGATLETNLNRIDVTEYIFGLPGTGDGDTAYLTLAQFGTAKQMSIGATVGSLAAYANVSRLGESTAQAGATRNVLTGDWVTATAYSVGDIVVKEGFRWVCLVAHISSGSILPPVFPATANTYWKLYGARGALTTSRAIAGSTWVDADAATAISDAGGVSPIQGDVVTLFNTTAGYSETRIRSSAGSWTALSVIFGGNVIVDNTLTASKIRAGAITADKVLITGRGSALNDDPSTSDISAWTLYSGTQPTIETITGAAAGRTALRGSNSTWVNSRSFAVDVNKKYRLRCWARRDTSGSPATGTFWLRAEWFDSSGTSLSFTDVAAIALTSAWLKRDTGEMTPPANAVSARAMLILNYNGTTGYHEAQDVRFEEIIGSDLIVDGSIIAGKISTGAVTTDKLDANSVTAAKIAAGAVTASKIAVGDFTVQARNWNFEEGDVGWTNSGGWTIVSDATNAKSGTWIARGVSTTPSAIRNLQKVAVEAGETFYAEAYVKHVSGAGTGTYLRCNIYNSAGAEIGYGTGNTITAATTTYTKSLVSFTVPANAATLDVGLVSNITGGTAYVDEVRLFRSSNTTLIADGAITTTKIGAGEVKAGNIFAGAVTADKIDALAVTTAKLDALAVTTAKLAAGSITASKMGIGDFENLCPNPSGETGVDGWTSGVVTGPNTAIGGLTAAVKSLRIINRDAYIGPWFDVTPGDQFYLTGSFYPAQTGDNPPTADAAVMMRFADDVSGTNSVWLFSAYANRTTNSWQTVDGSVTVPAGKRFAMMAVQINGTAGSTGSWHFRNIQVRRRNAGVLIVDGAISAAKIAAGAITTDKLLVTGRGAALNDDPVVSDISAWTLNSGTAPTIQTVTDGTLGTTTLRASNSTWVNSRSFAVDVNRKYRLRCWARRDTSGSPATGTFWLRAQWFNGSGTSLGYTDATSITALTSAWARRDTGEMTPLTGAVSARVMLIFNYGGSTGYHEAQDVRFEEVIGADLIVDGSIVAGKLAANSIAVGTAAIQNGAIVNAMIGDMSATKITAGYTQSVDIEAGKFFGSQFYIGGTATYSFIDHDGNPNTAQIKNGIVSVSNPNISMTSSGAEFDVGFFKVKNGASGTPDSVFEVSGGFVRMKQAYMRGLAVTDASGNIILAAGSPLAASNITPASGWLNSNISINADGSLTGAGSGQVSATGLGIVGLTLINDNNCTQFGDTIQKVSGGSAWNAGMRSREAYAGGAFASATAPSTLVDVMFGLNSSSATSSYEDIDYAIYFAGDGSLLVYEEGSQVGAFGTWSAGQTYTVRYDGTNLLYLRDGVVFYGRAVVNTASLFFDSSLYQPGARLPGVRFGPLTKSKNQNLLDSRTWKFYALGVQPNGGQPGFPPNPTSSGGDNYIEWDTVPDGSRGMLWRARSGSGTGGGAEGGWDSDAFQIDHTKMYRFTVWIRCFNGTSGSYYLGVGANTVNDIQGGVNGNPYFVSQNRVNLVQGEWYLLVGYVLPSGYPFQQQGMSGVYRASTGQRVLGGTDFRWVSGQATSWHRTYQYYTTAANTYQDFFDPRVELCDGTEPSLGELLAMGSPSARNQITSTNASTYIASAAIGDAQIANTIQSTNYSGSAGWQINKAGTATFNEVALRGAINGGAFTGWAWPATNNYGFHLGPNGLLLGNANNNKYFQVTSDGNLYAPGFTVINGVGTITDMTITRPTALATGTHSPSANNIFVYTAGGGGGKGEPGYPPGWDRNAVVFEIDTGYNDVEAINDVRRGAIVGNALVTATTYWYSGTAPGSNLLYRIQAEVSVYASLDHYTTGTSGPLGGRLYARIYVSLPRNIFSSIYQIRVDSILWQVTRVK